MIFYPGGPFLDMDRGVNLTSKGASEKYKKKTMKAEKLSYFIHISQHCQGWKNIFRHGVAFSSPSCLHQEKAFNTKCFSVKPRG